MMFERRPKIKKKRSTAETDGQQAQTTPHRARWLTILTEASGTNPVLLGYHQKFLAAPLSDFLFAFMRNRCDVLFSERGPDQLCRFLPICVDLHVYADRPE